ncbi:MAG: TRAP transporter substrate-binding protein DctP [SAR324 cluster bacterium]|nr:TRAP transporter substrate-binding protein DctP [SAR324 cluster bacterium]
MKNWTFIALIGVLLTIVLFANPAVAEAKVITIKFFNVSDCGDDGNIGMCWTMDEIERITDGNVKFQRFYNASLVKGPEVLSAGKSGLGDFFLTSTNYFPKEMPYHSIFSVPLMGVDPRQVARAALELEMTDPNYQRELKEWNLTWVGQVTASGPITALVTKPVRKLEDWKGVKVRTFGVYFPALLKSWGATPVALAWSETYDAISRGVVDGVMSLSSAMAFAVPQYEVTKFHIETLTGYLAHPIVMNTDKWNSLPENVKALFVALAPSAMEHQARGSIEMKNKALEKYKAEGLEMVPFSDEIEKWHQLALPAVKEVWISQNKDKMPDPGAVWNKYVSLLEKYRAWAFLESYPIAK